MSEKKLSVSQSAFEGCLLGGLVGDCFGFPFENEVSHHYSTPKIQQFFDNYLTEQDEEEDDEEEKEFLQYTDDTSMTTCVAEEFISQSTSKNELDPVNLAERFTKNYDNEKIERSYGSNVPTVFHLLKRTGYIDPYEPSHAQFNGQGSFGNGSGMRVAPVSLFTISHPDTISPLVTNAVIASRITHANPLGIFGGIFQALAVRHALIAGQIGQDGKKRTENPLDILAAFKSDFETLSSKNPEYSHLYDDKLLSEKAFEAYAEKIKSIEMLLKDNEADVQKIKNALGVKVEALHSIPTAFFCFLSAFHPISFIPTENQFQRTIQLAISLGGDTDTIGAMAGNIAGAYLGRKGIPTELIRPCEDSENIASLAQKLYETVKSR